MNLKEKITRGWQVSAEGYSALVQEDFQEETRRAWLELILNRAPQGKKLRILDAGTGPGFFAVILAAAGHETTGIDISSNMLMEAERNAARFGAAPRFLLMDSQSPDFPAASFDLILSRNGVWSLRKPRQAYAAWRQLLAPGGRLLVFDADYLRDLREPEFLQVCREAEAAYASRFGHPPQTSYQNYEEARGWRRELPLAGQKRPEWDLAVLAELGYQDISWEIVNDKVLLTEESRLRRSHQPLFLLCAQKGEKEEQAC